MARNNRVESTTFGELSTGDLFVDVQQSKAHGQVRRKVRYLDTENTFALNPETGVLFTRGSANEVIPVDSPDISYEEAIEQATRPLTAKDTEPGQEFRMGFVKYLRLSKSRHDALREPSYINYTPVLVLGDYRVTYINENAEVELVEEEA